MNEMYIIEKIDGSTFGNKGRIFVTIEIPQKATPPTFFSLDRSNNTPVEPSENRDVFILQDSCSGELLTGGDLLLLHPSLFERIPSFERFHYIGKRKIRFGRGRDGGFSEEWDVVEILYRK